MTLVLARQGASAGSMKTTRRGPSRPSRRMVAPLATYQQFQAKQDSSTSRQVRTDAAGVSSLPQQPASSFVEQWRTQLKQLFAAPPKEAWEDEYSSFLQNAHLDDHNKVMYHSHIAERMAEER